MPPKANSTSKKSAVTTRIPDWMRESLFIMAEKRKIPISEVIATAISTYLTTTKK